MKVEITYFDCCPFGTIVDCFPRMCYTCPRLHDYLFSIVKNIEPKDLVDILNHEKNFSLKVI